MDAADMVLQKVTPEDHTSWDVRGDSEGDSELFGTDGDRYVSRPQRDDCLFIGNHERGGSS